MTLEKLLEGLKAERNQLDSVIIYIERALEREGKRDKSKEILRTIKPAKRIKKRIHWTKKPGVDPAKIKAWLENMSKGQTKFQKEKRNA